MKVVVLKQDWADEFDIVGVRVFEDSDWEAFKEAAKKVEYPAEMYFGTNEAMEADSYEDYMSWLTVHDADELDINTLKSFLGDVVTTYGFGQWVVPLE